MLLAACVRRPAFVAGQEDVAELSRALVLIPEKYPLTATAVVCNLRADPLGLPDRPDTRPSPETARRHAREREPPGFW